ncbi:MerR family transcriptional regulator [Nostoc sp. CHAB 5715]|uniref:MerR family transcriptional regulator n=1 Tax=Nostoc sp. CHAB 5715 TaxID=2780400 RepID=UPI001E43DB50|nr:MerR family transcriptional regulator [Nostoc sp. CHAB 5715]MCC5625657.1 MerR family transcriptional regulator [Nostoc sp. CHAB 5715]
MTIGELASKSGIPASTIRYWERIGVLPPALRVSGQRRYAQDAIYRLAVLKLAQVCGFRLNEMQHLMHGFRTGTPASQRWQELACQKKRELDAQIKRLQAMQRVVDNVLHCDCADLSQCGRMAATVIQEAVQ